MPDCGIMQTSSIQNQFFEVHDDKSNADAGEISGIEEETSAN
jgi:hypothetical protein